MGWFSDDSSTTLGSDSNSSTLIGRAERFQKDVDVVLTEITRLSLPLQKNSFICSSQCFEGTDNLESITNCVKQCQSKPEKFGNAVQNELNQLQDLLLNCQQGAGEKSVELERCAIKCYDDNQYLLNDIKKRLENIFRNI